MADQAPTPGTPEPSEQQRKPEVVPYFNARAMQQANQTAGRWFRLAVGSLFCGIGLMMLFAMLLTGVWAPRHPAHRVKCASNLRQIGQALILYQNDYGCWPRTRYDPKLPLGNGFTGAASSDPFAARGPAPNDPTAALFLLVRLTDLSPGVFVCPSSGQETDTFTVNGVTYSVKQRSNFASPNNLSYSFANMYPDAPAVNGGYKLDPTLPADFALAADRNDGDTTTTLTLTGASSTSATVSMNSRNHEQEGQNVLYADGHVEWSATPWAGLNGDNIYTSAKPDPAGNQLSPSSSNLWPQPQGPHDTVLVPRKGNGF